MNFNNCISCHNPIYTFLDGTSLTEFTEQEVNDICLELENKGIKILYTKSRVGNIYKVEQLDMETEEYDNLIMSLDDFQKRSIRTNNGIIILINSKVSDIISIVNMGIFYPKLLDKIGIYDLNNKEQILYCRFV